MKKRAYYCIQVPGALGYEFMNHDFYIGFHRNSQKTANYWQANTTSMGDRYHLLKTAQEMGTDDLAQAYDKAISTKKDEDEEEE